MCSADRGWIEELDLLLGKEMREKVARELRQIGYRHVCVDLEGYRSGSMNEALYCSCTPGREGPSSGL